MNVVIFAIAALWGIGYLAKKAPVSASTENGQGSLPVSTLPIGGIPFEGTGPNPLFDRIAVTDENGNIIGYVSRGGVDKTSFILRNPAVAEAVGITPVLGGATGGGFAGTGEGVFSPSGGSIGDPTSPILV